MKRCLVVVLAASMFVAFAGVAQADHGMPSQATLQTMGLSGMHVMSDREAMGIRGLGYYSSRKHSVAIAFGVSYASVGGRRGASAGSIDGFFAKGRYHAQGKHGSIAGKIIIYGGGNSGPPSNTFTNGGSPYGGGLVKVKSVVVFAGGFAVSSAR